jgi:DNA-binding CsgD family transcriptional regulator
MLTQNEWEKLNNLIDSIYKTKNLTSMRNQFLQELFSLIRFHFSDFELGHTGISSSPHLVDAVVFSSFPKEFEQDFIGKYESVFFEFDYVKWVFSNPVSLVYRESDLINDEARKNSKFYVEYLKPFGFEYLAGISIISEKKFLGSVTLYRTESSRDFSDKDMYILKQLLPHLQNRLDSADEKKGAASRDSSYILKTRYLLTPREVQIVGLICKGASNPEIGDALGIMENTVKKHISNIFDKLEIRNRTELTHFILKNKIL